MKKINNLDKKYRILLFMMLDIILITVASIFAIWFRFDFKDIPNIYQLNAGNYIYIDIILMLIFFSIFRLYTSVWKYASILELLNVLIACSLTVYSKHLMNHLMNVKMPRSWYLIYLLVFILLVGGYRFLYRVLRTIKIIIENKHKKNNTMIIGAGDAGKALINEILTNPKVYDSKIQCIIDDNNNKVNSYINGIKIVGNKTKISYYVDKYNIQDIIIAIPSGSKEEISKIVDECNKTKCKISIIPSIFKEINDNNKKDIVKALRPLSYEDFLGRDQIVVNDKEIEDNIKNKVVLVTGGGGSIGSELCRQIAKSNPKELIIFDIYENNAYDIEQELIRTYGNKLNLKTIIGSVRDYDRLEKVFKENNINMIYHAAAHKHVPLMENSPCEAIKNNCLGTLNVCKLADKYKVEKFLLISSDKAVRPTNIMGATKRICEMIIQSFDKISKNTTFVAVRFGNVLGSNGSVIPLFIKQIENGGPVTVTDKNITRFFMTIPEAVSLVLQASTYAEGGEIFVLDMGKPVKIYELAKQIIRFKGYEPNKDIKIKITGLRPGEKLYEERLMDEEGLKKTPNELISIAKPLKISKTFFEDLDNLIKESYNNEDKIKDLTSKLVKTYKVDKRENK